MSNKNWFHLFKRFFFPKTPDLHEEKSNKRRRWFFRRLKRSPPTLASHESNASFPAAEEEAAAVASAAAADPSQYIQHTEEPNPDFLGIRIRVCSSPFTHQHERNVKHLAAIKIQTAFRGYLARKALRALKGLVRLQAIIRGRAVRRQAMKTLKCLQSVVNIQSQVCARRCQMLHAKPRQEMMLKVGFDSERRWDDQLSTEDEANASILTKTEALLWRERLRAYSFNNHRCSTESEDDKADGIMRRWLERYANAQVPTKDIIKRVDAKARKQVKLRQKCTKDSDPSMSFRRRSLQNKKRRSTGDDNLFRCSPMFPTYMAATESAKARLRSTSSPSLRPMVHSDAYSDGDSPYKHKLSPMSSINSDVTGKPICPQRRSLSLKGLSTPLGSRRILQDAGIESESLLLNRDCP